MKDYWKRACLAAAAAFVVLAYYTFAVKSSLSINVDMAGTILLAAALVSILSGAISAAVVRRRPVATILLSQLLAITLVACISRF